MSKTPPGPKELAQRAMQEARMARQHPLKKETAPPRKPTPYAGFDSSSKRGPKRLSKGEQRKKP